MMKQITIVKTRQLQQSVIKRFLSKIKIIESGCWEFTGHLDKYGYGQIKINRKTILTHRYIYEYYYGTICPDLTIDHLCRNRACCNPLHLEQVTKQENNKRGNSASGINKRKTHCKRGHEFTKENTIIKKMEKRCCKICQTLHLNAFRQSNTYKKYLQKTRKKRLEYQSQRYYGRLKNDG